MKTKPRAQSVMFNSGFLSGLFVFMSTVFLLGLGEFATANPFELGRAFSNGSAQLNPASQTPKTAQRGKLKTGFGEIHSSRTDAPRPLGQQCVTLREPIVTVSEASDIGFVDTAPAAFNSEADEFLISWDQLIGLSWAVFDQRLAADGTLLGDNNPVISGTDIFIEPAVAYSADTNQYFVTWRFQNEPGMKGFNNAFGTLVDTSGIPVGDVVQISNAGLEQTLVFNSVTSEFFHHARDFDGGGIPGIYFRRIAGDGTPLASPTPITTAGAPAPAGEVGVNTTTGEYLSTWRDQVDEDLKGRLLGSDGTPLTDPFEISDVFPGSTLAASVAYNPAEDQYLVVFTDFNSPQPLFGQFVNASGEPIGALITIVAQSGASFAGLAFDAINAVYLVRWIDPNSSAVWVQLLSSDGLLLGEAVNVFAGTTQFLARGSVVANKNEGSFLVTGVQTTDQGNQQVVARFVDVVSACLPSPTPTPSATPTLTPTVTPTSTPSATATATPTSTVTPSPTPIVTPTPTVTPRSTPLPRPRPTPHPRPSP